MPAYDGAGACTAGICRQTTGPCVTRAADDLGYRPTVSLAIALVTLVGVALEAVVTLYQLRSEAKKSAQRTEESTRSSAQACCCGGCQATLFPPRLFKPSASPRIAGAVRRSDGVDVAGNSTVSNGHQVVGGYVRWPREWPPPQVAGIASSSHPLPQSPQYRLVLIPVPRAVVVRRRGLGGGVCSAQ
jgi:hypothetical protein